MLSGKKMNYPFQFLQHKSLKDYSTIGIGGPARLLIEVDSIEKMCDVISYCHDQKIDFIVIGKGSNCLFDDKGFDGLVIVNKICFCEIVSDDVYVGAGFSFSLLGVQTARKGLSGLEFASGIPASVGGAVFMNAGASGQETQDCLTEVGFVNEKGQLEIFKKEDLVFAYRLSTFQKLQGAIVFARFKLFSSVGARKRQLSIIEYRTKTQPYGDKSAGCVFRNPHHGSAGALIEKSGLKGESLGDASVSTMHANFIINKDASSASDVLNLAEKVQQCVKEKTGIDLEMEIRCIPYKKVSQ